MTDQADDRIVIRGNGPLISDQLKRRYLPSRGRRKNATLTELVVSCPKLNALLIGTLTDIIYAQGPDSVWTFVELRNGQSPCSRRLLEALWSQTCVQQLIIHDACRSTIDFISTWLLKSRSQDTATIQNLKIYQAHQLSVQSASTLGESLSDSTVSRLELHKVRFGSSMIVEALAEKIAQRRKWQLVAFDTCYLEDNEVAAIARALSSRCCHVQEMAVPANYCQEEGMIAIAQLLLDSNVALKKLDLSGQDVWDDRRYFLHLERALSCSECCLEHLHLASSFIDDDLFITMLQSLMHNPCLRALDLRQNHISDRGIEYLSCLLPFLSMDTLDIRNNKYSSRPLGDLSNAMKHQRTMRNLRIDHCRRAPLIAFYTALNRAGRYCQGGPNFPLGLWPFVLENCQKTNDLPSSFSTIDLIFEMVKKPGLVLR